jgi:hypothetical protein
MIPEYFTNNIIFLTSVDVLGRTIIHNTLDVYRTLMVGESSAAASTLYVNEKVGILTETPNVELTVNGKISSNSVIYDEIGNSTQWNSVYTNINQNSATYAEINFVQNNFLPLSGGIMSGKTQFNSDVTIWGILSATGGTYFANTIYSTTSALSVIHVGSGPALYVGSTGTGDIASFYDLDQNLEMLHVGGHDGDFPNVGIKTSTPNVDFTVKGEISASKIIYDKDGNSTQWNSVYTTYNQNSATYATIEFSNNKFLPLSGGIVTGDLMVNNTLQVGEGNPNFDFIITEEGNVGINTETPNEKLTVVGNISCTGFLYGDGSNLTGIVAGDTQATTLVRTNSGFWQDTYTTVQANSGSYVTTVTTNTPGTSAVTSIVTVSAIPVVQVPGRLYILI